MLFPPIPGIEIQVKDELNIAGKWKRFFNYIIDFLFVLVFGYVSGVVLGFFFVFPFVENFWLNLTETGKIGEYIIGFFLNILFYSFFEYFFGVTPGKIITRTKVVTEEGKKPSFSQILIRTLCRFIPFEHFTFLSKDGIGWHDQFSKTRVINNTEKIKIFIPLVVAGGIISLGGIFFLVNEKLEDKYIDVADTLIIQDNFYGISFNYTDNWELEKEVEEENYLYSVSLIKKGNSMEIVSVSLIKESLDPELCIGGVVEDLKTDPNYKNSKFHPIQETTYNNLPAYHAFYEVRLYGLKIHGEIISFTDGIKTMILIKQAGSRESLKESFWVIEEGLRMD